MKAGNDTIVAIATPPGQGGIGVIRLSGDRAFEIASRIFEPKGTEPKPWPDKKFLYGWVVNGGGAKVDDGYAVRLSSPATYTGEEIVELQIHGSPATLQQTVGLGVFHGARLAEPGEFSRRGFLNGRMDLVQAEAVAELIRAESEAEAQVARRRLEGKLSATLHRLREETISVLAECEADVDFPEEGLSLLNRPTLLNKLEQIQLVTCGLQESYAANRRLSGGFRVALMGRPNVGKSSIFNALLSSERAIVTPIPGTTRDLLREELVLNGRRLQLHDTAGIREESQDEVEKIGAGIARDEGRKADLVLLVVESESAFGVEEQKILESPREGALWVIWNKTDLFPVGSAPANLKLFAVSAKTGEGIASLKKALGEVATAKTAIPTDGGIANDRQRELLEKFVGGLNRTKTAAKQGSSPELVAFELREAHRVISRILGRDEGMEDVLQEIFSKFCIGK